MVRAMVRVGVGWAGAGQGRVVLDRAGQGRLGLGRVGGVWVG